MRCFEFFTLIISLSITTSDASDDCLVIYLNDLKILEPFFGEIPQEYPRSKNCQNIIGKSQENFNKNIISQLSHEDDQNCIIENFNRYKIHNLYLKGKIYYEHHKTAIKNFTRDASESTADILREIKGICTADKIYGMEFNNSLKGREKVTKNSSIQNCLQKYFFERKILAPNEFGVDATKIKVNNFCEEIFTELESPAPHDIDPNALIYGLPSHRSQKCFFEKLEIENYLLKIASFGVALNMDLTENLIEKLRRRFIETRVLNFKFLLQCLEKVLIIS
jgi:hypothetical protein